MGVGVGGATSLVIQWLRLNDPNTAGTGSIPGQRTKIPHAAWKENYYKKKMDKGKLGCD